MLGKVRDENLGRTNRRKAKYTSRWISVVLVRMVGRKRSRSRNEMSDICFKKRVKRMDALDGSERKEKLCGCARATVSSALHVVPRLWNVKAEVRRE